MSTGYTNLLAPGRIGKLELKNRIILTAMGTNLAEEDGFVGDRAIAFHAERARGGAGMCMVGSVGVGYPIGASLVRQVAISDDKYIPGMKAMADALHEYDGKLALQLHFGGMVAMNDMKAGRPVWCPSLPKPPKTGGSEVIDGFLEEELAEADFLKIGKFDYKVMSSQDIEHMVQMFTSGAVRAREAGCDGVEIHAGHGYIISSFISPYSNQRSDEYGGSVENRARLLTDILRSVRRAVGPDFAVWCKIDTQEWLQSEGITLEDARQTALLAQAAGADAITASGYHDTNLAISHSTSNIPHERDKMVPNAAALKKSLAIPVIAAGRIEPIDADRYIAESKFDFIGMGRKLLADAHLPRKLKEGRADDVRPCIYCYLCVSEIYFSRNVKCTVSPETANERELLTASEGHSKKVVVVGGGPGGMETARRLAMKGHRVTLLERSDRLGGTLQFASIAYDPNERILNWLKRQVTSAGIDIRLNTEATPELLRELGADEVVVATGAIRAMPPIPGADRPNVLSGDDMRHLVLGDELDSIKGKTSLATRLAMKAGAVTGATKSPALIREASKAWMPLGDRIVIIGGELVGLELAEFLAHRGRSVTVIDENKKLGAGIMIVRRWRALAELRELGVGLHTGARDIAIGDNKVTYVNENGQARTVAADHVIVAKGAVGNPTLADRLRGSGFSVHTVGDVNGVGYIHGAIGAAAQVAHRI